MKIVLQEKFTYAIYAANDTLKNVYTFRFENKLGQYNLFDSLSSMFFGYTHSFLKKLAQNNNGITTTQYNEFIFSNEEDIKNFSKTLIKYELFMVRK